MDPGRLPESVAKAGLETQPHQNEEARDLPGDAEAPATPVRGRWCKKCKAVKPPRAHHCKQCER